MWASVSVFNGNKYNGVQVQALLSHSMTVEQIEEAHNLARQCIEKNYKGCDPALTARVREQYIDMGCNWPLEEGKKLVCKD